MDDDDDDDDEPMQELLVPMQKTITANVCKLLFIKAYYEKVNAGHTYPFTYSYNKSTKTTMTDGNQRVTMQVYPHLSFATIAIMSFSSSLTRHSSFT